MVRVYEWRQQHPEGRKADCHRETGLDPKTIRKWLDCPPPAVRFEDGHITVRVSPCLLYTSRDLYQEKNEHLERFLEPVAPYEFYRESEEFPGYSP